MNATEIVIREVQGNGGFQMRQLLTESVRQPRESAHLHSHGQVLPFHEAGRNLIGVGVALSDFGYRLRDLRWGVPRIRARLRHYRRASTGVPFRLHQASF